MSIEEWDGVLAFSAICSIGEESQAWAKVVMSLTRRLSEQAVGDPATTPFVLHVVFHAPGRYVQPDWSGVQLGRLSKRYGVLAAKVALAPTLPDDPVAAVIELAGQAVELACQYARRRKLANDLPDLREALRQLAEAGPAPVRHRMEPPKPVRADDESRDDSFIRVTSSSGDDEVDPSEGFLESLLDDLVEGTETFVQLDRIGIEAEGTLRLTRAGRYVQFERQDSADGTMLIARADDPDLIAEVLVAWTFQRDALPTDLLWQQNG